MIFVVEFIIEVLFLAGVFIFFSEEIKMQIYTLISRKHINNALAKALVKR